MEEKQRVTREPFTWLEMLHELRTSKTARGASQHRDENGKLTGVWSVEYLEASKA